MDVDFDLIVIGSGAGGATLAYASAQAGKSVLVLERGRKYALASPVHDERAMLIDKKPYDDRQIDVNDSPKRLFMGGVLGGSTALYGAALLRPSLDDFSPGKHYGQRIPREAWDWPVTYDELEPHYTHAEQLYGVAGGGDEDLGPLQKPREGYPNSPLPLHPLNEKMIGMNRSRGLRPFRLPLAIDPRTCLRCHACAGYICPTGARRSSAHLLERAAAENLPLRVLAGAQAEKFVLGAAGQVDGIRVTDRDSGATTVYRARRYVLAAGAIGSPLLLMRSGITHPLIGRHYMMHLSPIAIGVFRGPTGGDETFIKQVGFSDYYFGSPSFRHKLGLVQSLPVPGPLLTIKSAPKVMPRAVSEYLRRRMLPMAGIVEDLPNINNRVSWTADGRPGITHCYDPYDLERGRHLGALMGQILKATGARFCLPLRFASNEHVAHQCGTLRFGVDSKYAVLDRDCRLFSHPNVFVADGSFFPTSLGVGPALTIMANALRVAYILTGEI